LLLSHEQLLSLRPLDWLDPQPLALAYEAKAAAL
jgi:hypothetical protein